MGLLEKAEQLRQNLSLTGLLDIVTEICREIEKPAMLLDPNVKAGWKEKKKK